MNQRTLTSARLPARNPKRHPTAAVALGAGGLSVVDAQQPAALSNDPQGMPPGVRHALDSPGFGLDAHARDIAQSVFGRDFAGVAPRGPLAAAVPSRIVIGGAHDAFELDAMRTADRAAEGASDGHRAAPQPQRDFTGVRIHTGPAAAASAQALQAHAYTVGRDIMFGAGRYAPHTPAGRRLLIHELTHVRQQAQIGPRLQRDQDKATQPKVVPHRIKIPAGTTSKSQFRRYAETLIYGSIVNKVWTASAEAEKVYADIANHVGEAVTFNVPASELAMLGNAAAPAVQTENKTNEQAYSGLAPGEKSGIDAEIDRRYYATEGLDPGTLIQNGEVGKAAIWNSLKRQVMADKRKLDALPPEIRSFLFDDNAASSVKPEDYEHVLHIVTKITALSAAELAEYKSRVTAKTTDWNAYEDAIDRFIAERQERDLTAKQSATVRTRLVGLDALYDRYVAMKSLESSNAMLSALGASNPQALGTSLGTQPTINKTRQDLQADLILAGFPGGIADFEKLIRDCETTFETETLALAKVMLDQYAHTLWVEQQRYLKPGVADALYDQVNQSSPRADYEERDKIRDEHAQGVVMTPDEMADQAYWVGQRNQARARAHGKVVAAAASHPLVSERKFPQEALARAAKSEVGPLMLRYIADRQADIATTRKSLEDKPNMIYGLDELMTASLASQHIEAGSVQARIIKAHISDVHWAEAIPDIVLAVIAVAAGLLSGGGGALAVLAAGTALGIGAYQAVEEFRRYEMKSAASGAKLLSDDPSFAWVVVAVIGAGVDLGVFASVLPKLRPALQAFNAGTEAGDLAALTQKLEKLADVDEKIVKTVIRAADNELQARAAWKGVMKPQGFYSYIVPYADYFGRFVHAVYLSLKRGIRDLQLFAKTSEAVELVGDIAKLSVEELAKLKTAYLAAIEEAEKVALHGKGLGMADSEVMAFMNLRGQTKGMTVEQIIAQMDAWKSIKGSGVPFGFESLEKFEAFKSVASKGLKKARYADAEAILQGSAASGVSYSKKLPFGAHSDLDVAVAGRSLFEKARKLGYTVERNPMRIGPLGADQIKELDLGSMQQALSEAADGREVNLMLFGNRDAALQGIAGIKPESIPFK